MNSNISNNGNSSLMSIVRIAVIIGILVLLYYAYRYFFTSDTIQSTSVVNGVVDAKIPEEFPIAPVPNKNLPPLYEGGEYSMSCWVYINDWSYKKNINKHVFQIGGTSANDNVTLMVGLSNLTNKLLVRINKKVSEINTLMANNLTPSVSETESQLCDLPEIDMQKWVNIAIVLSGRICDVYLDGKLVRSCTLPEQFKVANGYVISPLKYTGFGGFMSNLTAYGYALNPGDVYKIYMSGPKSSGFTEWVKSFFTTEIVNVSDALRKLA